MADGSIAGAEPRKSEPINSSTIPPAAQKGLEAAAAADASKTVDAKVREPLRELIDKLERTQLLVARVDPALASVIKSIAERADIPGRLEDPGFRTRVAYATQDVEKLVGPMTGMQGGLREEMTRLAATSPGLHNERMQELVQSTPTIDDRILVRDIRKEATMIARVSDQSSADLQSKVDVLEHRLRLSARTPVEGATQSGPDGAPTRQAGTEAGEPAAAGGSAARTQAQASSATSSTRDQAEPALNYGIQPRPDQQATAQTVVSDQGQPVRGAGATFAIMAALRKPEPTAAAPWDQNLTPLAGRLAKYMETAQSNRDEAAYTAAERSGEMAAKALQAFANGPGAGIMAKISAASKADPDGMAGVVAGMREGGQYADLRRSFNADMAREKGLAGAVDRAATAVGQYGRDRTAADGIAAGLGTADAITARFGKLDAEIGKAASEAPGRKDGKSQMEELGEKAADLASKAMEAIKAAFRRTPGPEHRPSGPSASM